MSAVSFAVGGGAAAGADRGGPELLTCGSSKSTDRPSIDFHAAIRAESSAWSSALPSVYAAATASQLSPPGQGPHVLASAQHEPTPPRRVRVSVDSAVDLVEDLVSHVRPALVAERVGFEPTETCVHLFSRQDRSTAPAPLHAGGYQRLARLRLDALAAEVRPEDLRDEDRAVALLVRLDDRGDGARQREAGAVERVHELRPCAPFSAR